ncbi:hypothetical protein BBP40_001248 [Aspergillus hancockii]|nr:hypothetical protein BBP40_001248 [Aspergillus hancockii]
MPFRHTQPQTRRPHRPASGRISYLQLDTTDTASIQIATQEIEHQRQLQGRGLDVRIKNSGVHSITHGGTTVGSITTASTFAAKSTPAFVITKPALNMLTVQYALSLDSRGATVFALVLGHGGFKLTWGGDIADLPVETGAQAVTKIMLDANHE